MELELDTAAVYMLLTIETYLLVLINLYNPAILDYQSYCSETNDPESFAHLPFQFTTPGFTNRGSHYKPSKSAVDR